MELFALSAVTYLMSRFDALLGCYDCYKFYLREAFSLPPRL